jgi:hypothetical protein
MVVLVVVEQVVLVVMVLDHQVLFQLPGQVVLVV